jgi:hypothetical protein
VKTTPAGARMVAGACMPAGVVLLSNFFDHSLGSENKQTRCIGKAFPSHFAKTKTKLSFVFAFAKYRP